MIHQKIKDLFQSSVEHICSGISDYSVHPDIDFQRNESSQPKNLSLFSFHRGLHPQKLKCWTFGDWTILPCPLLLRLTSNVKS